MILSVIVKYSWETILPFIKSVMRANINNCDIVVFFKEVSKRIVDTLQSFGIITYNISEKYTGIPNNYRWKLYSNYLKDNKNKYNLVLCVDIRDTIIQNDIFKLYENHKSFLAFSYEEAKIEKIIMKNWIINTFGIQLFNSINKQYTINSGTVLGSLDIFIEFTNIIWPKLLQYSDVIDQVVINYIIYHEKILDKYLIFIDQYGAVLTLGLTNRKNIILDYQYNILNKNGIIASIVHQYDRHKDIKKLIKYKFCPEFYYYRYIIFFK